MNQLTIKDYKDILYVLEIANSHIDLVKLRRNLLHSLVKVFNASSGVFCLIDSNFKTLDTSTYETIYMHRQFSEQYFAYYFQYDPLLLWESKKTICQTSDILSPRDWENLPIYNDLLKHQNVYHRLNMYLRSGAKLFGRIEISRSENHRKFSGEEIEKASILTSQLTPIIKKSLLLAKIKDEISLMERSEDSVETGVILLDWFLQPVYWNDKAEEICRSLGYKQTSANDTGFERELVPSKIASYCSGLKKNLKANTSLIPKHERIINRGQNNDILITYSFIRGLTSGKNQNHFLITLEEMVKPNQESRNMVQVKSLFTNREKEVIQYICQGLTNEEISKKLCISKFTIANHVQNIFEKTGIRSRAKLTSYYKYLS